MSREFRSAKQGVVEVFRQIIFVTEQRSRKILERGEEESRESAVGILLRLMF